MSTGWDNNSVRSRLKVFCRQCDVTAGTVLSGWWSEPAETSYSQQAPLAVTWCLILPLTTPLLQAASLLRRPHLLF